MTKVNRSIVHFMFLLNKNVFEKDTYLILTWLLGWYFGTMYRRAGYDDIGRSQLFTGASVLFGVGMVVYFLIRFVQKLTSSTKGGFIRTISLYISILGIANLTVALCWNQAVIGVFLGPIGPIVLVAVAYFLRQSEQKRYPPEVTNGHPRSL